MILGFIFWFWRSMQIITLIPTVGMLAYFVNMYNKAKQLTPSYELVLFIVSVLAVVWAIVTLFRRKSTRESAIFVSFVDLCFVGAFIAGVYELRNIAHANCTSFSFNSDFGASISVNGDGASASGSSPISIDSNKTCSMLKASFAFGIMNCIFFFITSFLLLFMHRNRDERDVVVKETYRRRSHDSRRGHSRSGSGHHRRSHSSRRNYYV